MLIKNVKEIVLSAVDFKVVLCSLFNSLHMILNLLAFFLLVILFLGGDKPIPLPNSTENINIWEQSPVISVIIIVLIFTLSLICHSIYRTYIKRIKDKVVVVVKKSIEDIPEIERNCNPLLRSNLIGSASNILYVSAPSLTTSLFICLFSAAISLHFAIYLSVSLLLAVLFVLLLWYYFIYRKLKVGVVDSWVSALITGLGFSFVIYGFFLFGSYLENEKLLSTDLVMLVLILRVIYGCYKTAVLGFFRAAEIITNNLRAKTIARHNGESYFSKIQAGTYFTNKELESYGIVQAFVNSLYDDNRIDYDTELSKKVDSKELFYKHNNFYFCFFDILQGIPRSKWQEFCEYVEENSYVVIIASGSKLKQKKFENKLFSPLEEVKCINE